MKIAFSLPIVLLLQIGFMRAQTTSLSKNGLLQKRFYENFIFTGKDVSHYNFGYGSSNSFDYSNLSRWGLNIPIAKIRFKGCPDGNNEPENQICWTQDAQIGDATSELGYYIAYLATEYEIRKRLQQNTLPIIQELYKALKTYERLDLLAEYHYYGRTTQELNGFFLRDDFLVRNNLVLKQNNLFPMQQNFPAANYLTSDMRLQDDKQPHPTIPNTFMYDYRIDGNGKMEAPQYIANWPVLARNVPSQDQATYLMMGFALVKKFLPNTQITVDAATNIQFNFHQAAAHYTNLIVSYLRNNNYDFHMPDFWRGEHTPFASDVRTSNLIAFNLGKDIYIKVPADLSILHNGLKATQGTSAARFNSWGLAKAASMITNKSFQDFRNQVTDANYATWLNNRCGNRSWYDNSKTLFNRGMNLTLATIGDSWDLVFFKCDPKWWEVIGYAVASPILLPVTAIQVAHCHTVGNCTKNTMRHIDDNANRWAMPLTPILFRVLYDKTDYMPVRIYEMTNKMLRNMPCNGPRFAEVIGGQGTQPPIFSQNAPAPWTTSNVHVYKYEAYNTSTYGKGAYNGLDYLLLFNLYALLPEKANQARAANPALYPHGGLNRDLIPHPGLYTPYYYNPMIENLVVDNNVPKFGSGRAEFSGLYVLTLKNTDVYHRNAQTVFQGETEVVLGNGTRIFRGADVVIRVGTPTCTSTNEQWGYKDDDLDEAEPEFVSDSVAINRPEIELKPEVLPTEPQFNLYPNPVVGNQSAFQLQVFFPETQVEEGVALEVYSMEGRVVLKKQLPLTSVGFHQFRFTAQELGLSKGIYAVQVQHGTTKLTKRLIVQ